MKAFLKLVDWQAVNTLFPGGWYRIAWAFLKLVDADWRSSRFGQRVRLQMFKPNLKVKECWDGKKFNYVSTLQATDSRDEDTNIKDLWNWWRNDKLVNIINMIKPVTWFSTRKPKYPSTLWVTVKPVSPPTSSEPTLRWHQMTFDDMWWHVMTPSLSSGAWRPQCLSRVSCWAPWWLVTRTRRHRRLHWPGHASLARPAEYPHTCWPA